MPANSPLAVASPPTAAPGKAVELLRVLHVINGEYYAGAERVQDLLAKNLPAYGFSVGFAAVKLDLFDELRESRNAPLFAVPMIEPLRSSGGVPRGPDRPPGRLPPAARPYGADGSGGQRCGGNERACRWCITPTAPRRTTVPAAGWIASTAGSNGGACAASRG